MPTETFLDKPQMHINPANQASSPGLAEGDDEEISILDLLIDVAVRKKIILGVTAAIAVASAAISFILPPRYTAMVSLLPPQQDSSMGLALASQLGTLSSVSSLASGGGLSLKNPNDIYVGMLKSRTIEDAMVQRYGLMQEYHKKLPSDARKAFENHVTVDDSGKDNLLHIAFEDRDRQRAAELANGYVDQFRLLSQHLAITEASQRRLFFQKELEQSKNDLANAEEALKQTEQNTGLIQLDSQAKALIQSAAELRAQIAAKEVMIRGMQTYATGENAQYLEAHQELDGLRAQLAKLGGAEDNASGNLLVPRGNVPEAGLEYVRKERDVKYYETIFEILAKQFEAAKLDEAKEGSLIQVVDPAIPPDRGRTGDCGLCVFSDFRLCAIKA
jgi:uncharacterized protein involved in exopolysaccharide biosynthesis